MNTLENFATSSHTPFDVVRVPDDFKIDCFCSRHLVLDDDFLSQSFGDLNAIGSFPAWKCGRVAQGLARRVAARLAHRTCPDKPEKADAFADAWLFPIWRELAAIIPARHLARSIALKHHGKLLIIPLKSMSFSYLHYFNWQPQSDELEPLILAYALRKQGAKVILLASDKIFMTTEISSDPQLRVAPYSAWLMSTEAKVSERQCSTVIVEDGIRNLSLVEAKAPNVVTVSTLLSRRHSYDDIKLWGADSNPPVHSLHLRLRTEAVDGLAIYSPHGIIEDLASAFIRSVRPMTEVALNVAMRSIQRSGIRTAHICDCLFFESSLIAHAVRSIGGEVHLWPHSINQTFMRQHTATNWISSSVSLTTSIAAEWKRIFPNSVHYVRSEAMLRRNPSPKPLDPGSPLTVVIFAGAHSVARMPLIPLRKHQQSWVKLLRELGKYPEHFRVVFKPKEPWESSGWLAGLSDPPLVFEESLQHANELEFPNMIFMSVSIASAALIEGLGRGIPFMIARDMDVEDYIPLDTEIFPELTPDSIVRELLKCRDSNYFAATVKKQLEWYGRETYFDHDACQD